MRQVLADVGLAPNDPQGSYFMLGDFRKFSNKVDADFAVELAERVGVATIPAAGERLKSGFSRIPG